MAMRPRSRSAEIIEHKYNKNIIIIILLLVANFQGNISINYLVHNKIKNMTIICQFDQAIIIFLINLNFNICYY